MFKRVEVNRVLLWGVILALLYVTGRFTLGTENLIIALNGAFVGAVIAYMVAFSDILRDAVFGHGPYDRVRQMALGFMLVWVAVMLGVFSSVYARSTLNNVPFNEMTPIARYLAIVGGVVQITAPDFGMGLLYGRDRRLLVIAISAGILAALTVIVLQT